MAYLNIETGEYPRHQGDLELLGWQIGEPLPPNWVEVEFVEPPQISSNQIVYEGKPINENGWKMTWEVRDLTEKEIQLREFMSKPKQKLAELGLSNDEIQALILGLR